MNGINEELLNDIKEIVQYEEEGWKSIKTDPPKVDGLIVIVYSHKTRKMDLLKYVKCYNSWFASNVWYHNHMLEHHFDLWKNIQMNLPGDEICKKFNLVCVENKN